ncbi:MAG: HAD family hydrolase [Planctomycetota bacterium]|jgi:phosphoglycolate phosphatase-like HAD superfamily hydrolase
MTESKDRICFLFDLDGTLVLTGGAGLRAFDKAFKDCFQADGKIEIASPAGKTDPNILRHVCEHFLGRTATSAEERTFFDRYLECLVEDMRTTDRYQVMPGIKALLEHLDRDDRCLLGLGTGNIEKGAEIKLRTGDLWRYFRFGGFGSDASERAGLLRKALERAEALLKGGERIRETYVIGDTPHDIQAGRSVGARTVGVATGPYDLDELKRAGADFLYEDLGDFRTFLADIKLV